MRDYAAAKQSHEQALAIRRNALPQDHPDIAASLNNLGNVQDALRDYAAAKQSHEQALAIRRKALPQDHPDIAQSLSNLGAVQSALREYAAAKQSHEQALAIRRKALPPDHPDIATSLNNLGMVQYALREYAAAKQSYRAGAGDLPQVSASGPPPYRHQSEQPGDGAARVAGVCGGQAELSSRRWRSDASPCHRTTPISPPV